MASGNTLRIFSAIEAIPATAAYATIDVRNQLPVLDYSHVSAETAYFSDVIPQHYAGTTGITVLLHAGFTTAVSGSATFDVSFDNIGTAGNVDLESFATAKSVIVSAPTSGRLQIASVSFAHAADIDSLAKGLKYRMKVTRAVSGAEGDAELHQIELRET